MIAGLLSGAVGFGGGMTGLVNGLLGISGPLSSAVFLTLDLAPVAYIASEATAAAAMIVGNIIAMHYIRNVNKKRYQRIVASVMIAVSIWLIISNIN